MSHREGGPTWAERFVMEPVYYWLDLYGPDGRPSHHKTLSAWGFFAALGVELWWMLEATEITWPFVGLVAMTLALPMGKDAFKAALGMRSSQGPGAGP